MASAGARAYNAGMGAEQRLLPNNMELIDTGRQVDTKKITLL